MRPRQNFGGELDISCEGLPAGISAEPVTMAGNLSSVPVLFSADADGRSGRRAG